MMRDAIEAEMKLQVTLNFLATGNSYRNMYTTCLHTPEVCDALSKVLNLVMVGKIQSKNTVKLEEIMMVYNKWIVKKILLLFNIVHFVEGWWGNISLMRIYIFFWINFWVSSSSLLYVIKVNLPSAI